MHGNSYIAAQIKHMARLSGMAGFTGSFGDVSIYKMRGVEKLVVRQKGGASRDRIRRDRNFEMTRRHNQEWKACVMAAQQLLHAIYPVKHLADYNYSGQLTAICKSIQKDDSQGLAGQREILLSQFYYKLEGFSLNTENTFESIVKHPLQYDIDSATGKAVVQIPEIVPGINLNNPRKQPLYRFVVTLGVAADIVYKQEADRYIPATDRSLHPSIATTPWCSYRQTAPAIVLSPSVDVSLLHPQQSLVLAVGIEFGVPVSHTEIRPVKYAGAAKVLKISG